MMPPRTRCAGIRSPNELTGEHARSSEPVQTESATVGTRRECGARPPRGLGRRLVRRGQPSRPRPALGRLKSGMALESARVSRTVRSPR